MCDASAMVMLCHLFVGPVFDNDSRPATRSSGWARRDHRDTHPTWWRRSVLVAVVTVAATLGTTAAAGAPAGAPAAAHHRVLLPPANGRFDYQIGGAYKPLLGRAIVDRDRTSHPAPGVYNICYINAFQTQAYQDGWWKQHHPALLLRNAERQAHRGSGLARRDHPEHLDRTPTGQARERSRTAGCDGCKTRASTPSSPTTSTPTPARNGLLTQAEDFAFARLLVERRPRRRAGDRAEERCRAERAPRKRRSLRLRDRRGVPGLQGVRLLHQDLRRRGLRDRVHRQRPGGVQDGMRASAAPRSRSSCATETSSPAAIR